MEDGKSRVKNKLDLLAQYVIDLMRLDCILCWTSGSVIQSVLTCGRLKHSSCP